MSPIKTAITYVMILLAGFVCRANAASRPIFNNAPKFAVGITPVAQVTGDFNHDGNADLAVLNRDSSNVSILLGTGKASFSAPVNYPVGVGTAGIYVSSIVAGDLNNDGSTDLVIGYGSGNSGGLTVLLGKADGTFAVLPNLTVSPAPNGIAIGDFNGDGKLDLMITATVTNLLLGNGDGTFQSPISASPYGGYSIAPADFNHDGKLDFAIGMGIGLSVAIGNGDGSFQSPQILLPAHNVQQVLAADLNNDGKLDLAALENDTGDLFVLIGDGDGTFSSGGTNKNLVTWNSSPFVLADFNGDGILDLAAAVSNGSDVVVALGRGAGRFGATHHFLGGINANYPVVADFNNDGVLDIAAVNVEAGYPNNGAASVLLGDGTGSFAAPRDFPVQFPNNVATGDFNEDGFPDIAVVTGSNNPSVPGSVSILLNQKTGNFSAPTAFSVGFSPFTVAVADLNGDGHLDLVTSNYDSQTASVLLGDGKGGFQPDVEYAVGGNAMFVSLADFNHDGVPDMVVGKAQGDLSLLLGNGDGTFQPFSIVSTGLPIIPGIAVADFNGDGNLDVAAIGCFGACYTTGALAVLLGNGDGTFQSPATQRNVPIGPDSIAVSDVNRDGKQDLIIISTDCCTNAGFASILLGNGDGTFQTGVVYNAGTGAEGLAVADFDLDGKIDLVIGGRNAEQVGTLLGNGDGTFREGLQYPVGVGAYSLAVADFNRDGKPDLTMINSEGAFSVGVLLNQAR